MAGADSAREWVVHELQAFKKGANPRWVFVGLCSLVLHLYQYGSSQNPVATPQPCIPYSEDQDVTNKLLDVFPNVDYLVEPYSWSVASARQLAGNSSGVSASASSNSGGHEGPHQHDALLFMFNALIIGIAVLHLKFHHFFHDMQETVALFVIGVVYSLVQTGLSVQDDIGKFGDSYSMWMDIDPHLLLFTLLPALLTGDAMGIDTSVAKRVGKQCLYLAGPGVLFQAMVVAWFLKFYFDWSFLLSLVTGSILCATDPVAVVALLKELGASPVLTIQIQGESLLNDGTAIVLFSIAYRMLQGESFDSSDILMFLITVAVLAWGLGMVVGYCFFLWIRAASNKLQHSSEVIQIALTLISGYWSFIMAEGVFHISGVLACVASALVLAHFMWPHIVAPESMHHVWHMLETLGNIIIFFLAGALTGKAMTEIDPIDYVHLIVIYIVLLIVRGSLLFCSRPLLQILSADKLPVSKAEAAVMTWGGLRGAVGLALAIQVHHSKAPDEDGVPQISDEDARRVLFYVGGIALLTTIINATTCPALVNRLGITAHTEARQSFIKLLHTRLVTYLEADRHSAGALASLQKVFHHVELHINHMKTQRTEDKKMVTEGCGAGMAGLMDEFNQSRQMYREVDQSKIHLLGYDDETNKNLSIMIAGAVARERVLEESAAGCTEDLDRDMSKLFVQVFLNYVNAAYYRQMDKRTLPPGSDEANILLHSVQMCLSYPKPDLTDFQHVFFHFLESEDDDGIMNMAAAMRKSTPAAVKAQMRSQVTMWTPEDTQTGKPLAIFLEGMCWNTFIAVVIFLNAAFVGIEEAARDLDQDSAGGSAAWLVIEVMFNALFLLEAVLKLVEYKHRYFCFAWNHFDFVLVVLGIFGIVVEVMARSSSDADVGVDNEARLLRVTRVFKVARLLRVFRLFNLFFALQTKLDRHGFSMEQGTHLRKFTSLTAFIKAHLHAQRDFVKLLIKWVDTPGSVADATKEADLNGNVVVRPELARVLLQSQSSIYKASVVAMRAIDCIKFETLDMIRQVRESQDIAGEVEHLVLDALHKGVLGSRDAECITHPLHEHISHCQRLIGKAVLGFEMGEELKEEIADHGHGHHHDAEQGHSTHAPQCGQPSAKVVGQTDIPGSVHDGNGSAIIPLS